jgi:hypothetical protein
MFRRESSDHPKGNAERALAGIDALRQPCEGEVLGWSRGTSGLGKQSGGSGIRSAVYGITDTAFYLCKGNRWVHAARIPLDGVAFAEVSLFRPGYVRLELVGREREMTILVLEADKPEPQAVTGPADAMLATEPWLIVSEKEASRFLGLVGNTIRAHHAGEK